MNSSCIYSHITPEVRDSHDVGIEMPAAHPQVHGDPSAVPRLARDHILDFSIPGHPHCYSAMLCSG